MRTGHAGIRPTRRSALLGGSAAAVGALGLAACSNPAGSGDGGGDGGDGGDSGPAANWDEHGPITYATGKDTSGALKGFLETWNKEHSDEKVTLVELPESADEQRSQMINNAQAKSDAYTVLGLDVVWTAEFAANQWVVELPEDKLPLDQMIEATVSTGTYFDKLYAMPFSTNSQLLFSRKDLLEDAGYTDPPKTFDEMWEIVEKVQDNDKKMKGFAAQLAKYEGLTCTFTGMAKSAGADLFDEDGKPTVTSDGAVTGLTSLREGFDKGFIAKEALTYKEEESRQAFQDGTTVFLQNWPYVYDQFQADDGSSKVKDKVLVSVVPGVDGDGTSTLGGLNLAVSAFGKNMGTALDFIMFMSDAAQQKDWLLKSGNPTCNEDVYSDEHVKKEIPYLDILKSGIDGGVSRPHVVKYGDVTQDIQESVYGCISGGDEPEATLKSLQSTLESAVGD
jgi:multiple sugar transport system substrate-binding protein